MWSSQARLNRIWRHKVGRSILIALLVLSPVALGIAVHSKLTRYHSRFYSIETNRERCIEIANAFVTAQGGAVPEKGWSVEFDEDREFLDYLHRRIGKGEQFSTLGRLPIGPAAIRLKANGKGEDADEVTIGPRGAIQSYRLPFLLAREPAVPDDRDHALAIAKEQLAKTLTSADFYQLSDVRVYEQTDSRGRKLFRVEWTATNRNSPELTFTISFGVAGNAVFSKTVSADVNDDYMANSAPVSRLYSALTTFAPFYIIALIVYMLVRYIQRSLEKEVSHGRALVVAVYILAMITVLFVTGDQNIVLNIEVNDTAPRAVIVLIYFFLVLAALLAGASYSACEGDVRENFKGSLTAFDALLTGKVLSRNVAQAFVVGFVAAAWLFALQVGANLAFEGGLEEPSSLFFVYRMAHSQFPAAIVFFLLPMGVGFVLLFGLLIPVSIVARIKRFRKAAWVWLLLMVLLNLFLLHGGFVTLVGAASILGAEAVTMLALFLYFDLMTALVCRVLLAYLTVLTDVQLHTLMPEGIVLPMHAIVAATLVASFVLMRVGKEYSDEEVMPSYAVALAERQSLSEQLSAAAVAQAQLAVTKLPQVEGFSLAAECKPARIVSGDYFEGFRLGPGSIGVLMISGAGRGLLDAMVIAFTKGFLLERAHASRSAQDLLSDLLQNLTALLEPSDAFPELCFVLLDSGKGTASYSRTAEFPGVVSIRWADELAVSVRQGSKVEMTTTRHIADRTISLHHGAFSLEAPNSLLLFTCGFARSVERSGIVDFREWLRGEWMRLASSDAGATLAKLTANALGGAGNWQGLSPEDDRTLMVVHAMGAVAEKADRAA